LIKNNILKIGDDNIYKIHEILSDCNINGNILFVTDELIDKLYGSIVKKQINRLGNVECGIINDNSISYAMAVAERIIATDINYIIGLGGGKVLDVCKYAAYVSKIPFISIPTALANDGVASAIAVLKRNDGKPKSLGCAMPAIIIVDTCLIYNSPVSLIKAGIGDTISNYMSLLDWELACERKKDRMNDFAYLMSRNSLDALMRTQYDHICPEFIHVLANSIVLSGIAMEYAGSSRPVSGSEHLFSHALDYYAQVKNLHGIQVALGTIAILKLLGFEYRTVLNYLKRFEVDISPASLGISQEDFVFCMQHAREMRKNRYTYLDETDLGEEKLIMLYNELVEEL